MKISKIIALAHQISPLTIRHKIEFDWENLTLQVDGGTIGWIDSGRLCNVFGEDGSFFEIYGRICNNSLPANYYMENIYSMEIKQYDDPIFKFDHRFLIVKRIEDDEEVPALGRPGPIAENFFQ